MGFSEVFVLVLAGAVVVGLMATISRPTRQRTRVAASGGGEVPVGAGPSPASPAEPSVMLVGGHPLRCGHCGGAQFEERQAQLNTAMATFFNIDWANRSATCFVCDRCGHIEWFLE